MDLKIFFFLIYFLCLMIYGTLGSSSVDCDYGNNEFYTVGYKYRCRVSNNLNISSPESALIDSVSGTHMNGKSNNDEIYFHAHKKHIEYFPRGLEKFFTNLTGIQIWNSQLKEIHQEDLKHYTKLQYFCISSNDIEVIEDGLFDFQLEIEVIFFDYCKIFHISSTVFDNLSKLTTLFLGKIKCDNIDSSTNHPAGLEIFKNVKRGCYISSDYLKLNEKLKNIEQSSKNVNTDNLASFMVNLENLKDELKKSNISGSQILKRRIDRLSVTSILLDKNEEISKSIQSIQNQQINSMKDINIIKNSVSESNNRTANRNQWMIIATGVIAFTQTIFFVVIYMQFIQ